MNATVITEATGLRIWPTSSSLAWMDRWTEVHALFDRPPFIPDVTPGTLKVSDTEKEGTAIRSYRKTITFSVPETSRETVRRVLTLSKSHLAVVYADERGVDRLVGGVMWPATLSFVREKGSLNVTVSAWGDEPNPEFILMEPRGSGLTGPF